jgi:sulfane dehydrogenase subunit SoxC
MSLRPNRRSLLGGLAAATGGWLASGSRATAEGPPLQVPAWTRQQGSGVASPGYGIPSRFENGVVRRPRTPPPIPTAASSGTPLQHLHGIITPAGLHYERHHAGVPAIDPDQHRLVVHGLVDRPLIFSMDDLLRFPSVSRIHFLECSGNTASWGGGNPKWTVQDTHGLISCSEWTGVPLATVLAEARLKPEAKWVLAEGADASAMTRSVPIEIALDDAILAYAQNGERLRPEQGYPLRLFLPGIEGNMSVKWLRRLKVGDQPFQSREETSKYTDLMPDGSARQFTFVMEAKSVITQPSSGHQLRERGFYEIRGLAWSGRGSISKVEVSADGGKSWRLAELQQPVLPKCLTRFRLPWEWSGGPALLQSRATDNTGYLQPSKEQLVGARGVNSFYHFNAIYGWQVDPNGAVAHVA